MIRTLFVLALLLVVAAADGKTNGRKLKPGERLDQVTPVEMIEAKEKKLKKKAKKLLQKKELKLARQARKIDTVVVRETVLQGHIVELTDKYVDFSPVYGRGSIKIDYKNIEQITTEHEYHIFYNGKETTGRIVGIRDHTFLIVLHNGIKEPIRIANIDRVVLSVNENDTIANRLKNIFPFTRGSLDVGIETESGVKRKQKIAVDYHFTRKKIKRRQIVDMHYAYETTTTSKAQGDVKSLDKKELVLFAEENYLLGRSWFYFAQTGFDMDEPRSVRARVYPALGVGYRWRTNSRSWIQFKGGAGYVYESFLPYTPPVGADFVKNNDYAALFVGISAKEYLKHLILIKELVLSGNLFYMPSVTAPEEDWLARMVFTAEIPISSMLSLKWVYRIVNDDNPVPEVGNNKTTTNILFSLKY